MEMSIGHIHLRPPPSQRESHSWAFRWILVRMGMLEGVLKNDYGERSHWREWRLSIFPDEQNPDLKDVEAWYQA